MFELKVMNIKNRRLLKRVRCDSSRYWKNLMILKSLRTQKSFQMEVRTWMIPKSLRSQVLKVEQKVVEEGEVGQQSLLEEFNDP